jgi:hypothetical protein
MISDQARCFHLGHNIFAVMPNGVVAQTASLEASDTRATWLDETRSVHARCSCQAAKAAQLTNISSFGLQHYA